MATYLSLDGLEALWTILDNRDTETQGKIASNLEKINGIIGEDSNKSIREIAAEEVALIVDNAHESYDTLHEIAEWIQNDTTGAAKMADDISNLKTTVGHAANANPAVIATGLFAEIERIDGEIGTVTESVVPIATVLASVKSDVGKASVPTSGGQSAQAATGLHLRIETLETNMPAVEEIPVNSSGNNNSIQEICVFSYSQS